MEKILIVEDDTGIADFEKSELIHEGYNVVYADDGRKALEVFEAEKPDLVLLDIMIPSLSGLEVLRRIRKESQVPVILVTARGETYDKVTGLNAGADDYIAKPFEIEELLARMNAVLRRSRINSSISRGYRNSSLVLNPESMSVTVKDKDLTLSKTEFLMLKYFMENLDTVLNRDQIIDAVWGKDHYIDENNVDVYVGYLRNKIATLTTEDFIITVRGAGYKMINKN